MRQGKYIDIETDPFWLETGEDPRVKIRVYPKSKGPRYVTIWNMKRVSRDMYDSNYFGLEFENENGRTCFLAINKDELEEALKWV